MYGHKISDDVVAVVVVIVPSTWRICVWGERCNASARANVRPGHGLFYYLIYDNRLCSMYKLTLPKSKLWTIHA